MWWNHLITKWPSTGKSSKSSQDPKMASNKSQRTTQDLLPKPKRNSNHQLNSHPKQHPPKPPQQEIHYLRRACLPKKYIHQKKRPIFWSRKIEQKKQGTFQRWFTNGWNGWSRGIVSVGRADLREVVGAGALESQQNDPGFTLLWWQAAMEWARASTTT